MIKFKRPFYTLCKASLLLVVIWVSFNSVNFYTASAHVGDSAIFANVGFHMFKGKALYKAAYDHKLPPIFYLNLLAFKLAGPGTNSVYAMERLFAVGFAIIFLLILIKIFPGNFLIAIIFTLVFLRHFYTPLLFSSGNYTEEYGSVFLLTGVLFMLHSTDSEGYKRTAFLIVSGIFLSLAALTKEPFLLLIIPWTGCLFLRLNVGIKEKIRLGVIFFMAVLLPALLIVVYFMRAGHLQYLIDVVSNNLAYSKYHSTDSTAGEGAVLRSFNSIVRHIFFIITTNIFFALGLSGSFSKQYNTKYRHIPLILLIWFIAGAVSVNLTRTHFSHYYLILVAPFTALAASGAFFLDYTLKRYCNFTSRLSAIAVITLFALCLSVFDSAMTYQFYDRIKRPFKERRPEDCSYYIKNNTTSTDYIWAPTYNRYTYLESGRLSPTSYIYVLKHLFIDTLKSTGTQKAETLLKELKAHPPKLIAVADTTYFNENIPGPVINWVFNNYSARVKLKECVIFQGLQH